MTSDLWEQAGALGEAGQTTAAVLVAVWLRWLGGMPDDVLWRREQPRARRGAPATLEGSSSMFGSESRGALALPVGGVLAAVVAAIAVSVIGNIQHFEQSERLVATAMLDVVAMGLAALGLASLVTGFAIMHARPAIGVVLAVGGSAVAGLIFYWLIVPLILAAAISIYAVRRARRIAAAG
jgi:hypothetical protein